jgi:hypothetical protein
MQFLALARRRIEAFPEAVIAEQLPAEAERVRELYAAGVMRTIYSRGDVPGAPAPVRDARRRDRAATPVPWLRRQFVPQVRAAALGRGRA